MISEPPMNSPFTYSCGIVGHDEYILMPFRMELSSSTLTVSNGVSNASRIRQAVFENPLMAPIYKICGIKIL